MVAITVTKDELETLFVEIALSDLVVGTRYDVYRLQMRYLGDDDTGAPVYEREFPDRRDLWSAVAHRIGWEAGATIALFRDYECPMRPTAYFVVATTEVGPFEYNWANGDYPLSRGVMASTIVHWNRDLELALTAGEDLLQRGSIIVRSTSELGMWVSACVFDFDTRYTARGTELAVMGRQYPMYVADTREARRGSLVVRTDTLGQYDDFRRIVFPPDGRIRPAIMNSGPDATLLLDDCRFLPLDVSIEQATQRNADMRFITLDYVEVDPTAPLVFRSGDNDDLTEAPRAQFTISDTTAARGQWITLTDTSTGQIEKWDWTIEKGSNNKPSKFYTAGPHKVKWGSPGKKTVRLRVSGSEGAHVRTKTITVR